MSDTLAPRTPRALGELLPVSVIRGRYFGHIQPPPSDRWIAALMPLLQRVRVGKSFCWWRVDIESTLSEMRGAA